MSWHVAYYEGSENIPFPARAALLRALCWCEPATDGVVLINGVAAKERASNMAPGALAEGLRVIVDAGWLAPIEVLADGSLRTRLTLPAGVVL